MWEMTLRTKRPIRDPDPDDPQRKVPDPNQKDNKGSFMIFVGTSTMPIARLQKVLPIDPEETFSFEKTIQNK